jgi:hypothetical protein
VIRRVRPAVGALGDPLPIPPKIDVADEEGEGDLLLEGVGHGGLRRWLGAAWLALPLAVAVAIVSSAVGGGGRIGTPGAPGATSSTAFPKTSLPSMLISVEADQNAGKEEWGVHVGPGTGFGVTSSFSLDSPVVHIEVGPRGQVAAIDSHRALHLLPDGWTKPGPVLSAAFSPDGRFLAICTAKDWPPALTVVPVVEPDRPVWPAVSGCDPKWSADSNFIAYRLAALRSPNGSYVSNAFGVLRVLADAQFKVPGAWPMARAPTPGYAETPLTEISADRDSVSVMDPSGHTQRTLVSGEILRRLTGGRAFGPLELLAWSPDGKRIAIGSAEGAAGFGLSGVAVLDPYTGDGAFVGAGYNPISLTWSVNQELLAEFEGPTGRLTWLVPKSAPFVELLDIGQASWAPDGRWILARAQEGWVAIDSTAPERRVGVGEGSSQWTSAVWCCPPVPVANLSA